MTKTQLKTQDIVYMAISAAILAICSQISIPGTIPFTLQTFAAAFIGGYFGVKRGAGAVLVYILLGIAGIPVFAGFRAGFPVLLGGTGGYIIGLIPFAAIAGFFAKRSAKKIPVTFAGMFLGLVVCYALGTAWYVHIYAEKGLMYALLTCVTPFILPDAVKLFLAALLVKRLPPVSGI